MPAIQVKKWVKTMKQVPGTAHIGTNDGEWLAFAGLNVGTTWLGKSTVRQNANEVVGGSGQPLRNAPLVPQTIRIVSNYQGQTKLGIVLTSQSDIESGWIRWWRQTCHAPNDGTNLPSEPDIALLGVENAYAREGIGYTVPTS